MKVVALVGEHIAPAFRLMGIETASPFDNKDLKQVFQQLVNRKEIAMIAVSARFAPILKDEIAAVRLSKSELMILEISSSQGNYNAGDKLMQYINKVIGQG
ncbi:MAG: V-type ATP synthase subunit F [Brevinemataceae bacterium]